MYTCKKCGTPLEKQLSECPICHTKNPAGEPESMAGKDLTETYDPVAPEFVLIRQKSRKLAAVLAFTLGFLGIPLFYLGYKRSGLWWLFVAIVVVAIGILWVPISYYLIGALLLAQIGLGLVILTSSNLKDGRGELLR
ncbi:MAG: NINE protein [Bacilli bacterium]